MSKSFTRERIVRIDTLAHKGDGRAETPEGPLHVPFVLPGEQVRIAQSGARTRLIERLEVSPERVTPVCRHYETCGGCVLQHMAEPSIRDWKRNQVVAALSARGFDLASRVCPTIDACGRGRRRAVFAATRVGNRVVLGFHERASHRVVDLSECPVLVPEIVSARGALKQLAIHAMPRRGEVTVSVLATTGGLDVALDGRAELSAEAVAALVGDAMAAGIARLSWKGETLVEAQAPILRMGGIAVVPPPGGFVQATQAGEDALATLVCDGVADARKIADLFCGVGTFALRLARSATVQAVESEAGALKSLDMAMRGAGGLLREVRPRRRDLFRNPITSHELDDFGAGVGAVVFDPPRAGAEAQAREIARSGVPRVVAVSCNPATFARDLRHLVDGGYEIETVTPVDQFRFSSHIEVVACLTRA